MAEIENVKVRLRMRTNVRGEVALVKKREHFMLPSHARLKREMWHGANLPPATWRHVRMVSIDVSNEYLT